MGKKMALVPWMLAAVLLWGCAAATGNEDAPKPGGQEPAATVADYYPLRENTRYVYEGMGNEYASYDVYTEYADRDKVQQRVDNGGAVLARVIKRENGSVIRVLTSPESYVRENLLDAPETEREILLMEPLEVGNTWKVRDEITRTIAGISAEVATPSGNYQALEVVTEGPGYRMADYYAKNVGLVKSAFLSGEAEITSSLSQIENDVPRLQRARFYYPGAEGDEMYFLEKELRFYTNDSATDVYEAAYRQEPGGAAGPVFSPGTRINSLARAEDGTVLLDLNGAFLSEMNAGSQYEATLLQCVASTFGQLYQAERLLLTIDGQPYASGHINLGEGETLPVEYDEGVALP